MRKTLFQLSCFVIIGAMVLSACNVPGNNAAADTPQAEQFTPTDVATVAPTATPTEVVPTETPMVTATETPIPEPSITSTPELPKAEVLRESNCRVGPGGIYDLVATYQAGQMLEVVAKDLGGGYWFVRNPEKPEEQCYLLAQNITITGDIAALPKFTPRPSPTAAPYFKVAFKKLDKCKGEDFALFTLENTGSVPFRSAYIKVTDQRVNRSVEQAVSAFDLYVGCVLAKNIAPLDPGGTGYLTSPPFKWSVSGHKVRAVIMLCTEKALKGTCVTQSIDVKT
jgi:hypothetical protein